MTGEALGEHRTLSHPGVKPWMSALDFASLNKPLLFPICLFLCKTEAAPLQVVFRIDSFNHKNRVSLRLECILT